VSGKCGTPIQQGVTTVMADFNNVQKQSASFAKRGSTSLLSQGGNGLGRGRGTRISSVISEARASLKEPSRPFTPASLDERAQNSLDGALNRALDREISRTSSAASNNGSGSNSRRGSSTTADIWVNDNIGDSNAYLQMGSVSADLGMGEFEGDVRSSNGSMNMNNLHGMLTQNLRNSLSNSQDYRSDSHTPDGSVFQMGTSASASASASDESGEDMLAGFNSGGYGSAGGATSGDGFGMEDDGSINQLSLMLADLGDATHTLESEVGTSTSTTAAVGTSQTLLQVLTGLSQPVDRLAKYVRRPALAPSGSAVQDVEAARASLTRVLLRIVRPSPSNLNTGGLQPTIPSEIRALACRHLLRLYIGQLQRGGRNSSKTGKSGKVLNAPSSSSSGSNEVARGVLRVTRTIFEMSNASNKAAKASKGSRSDSQEHKQGHGNSTAMLEGGLQLLLDLLAHAWDTVHAEVTAMSSNSGSTASGTTSHPLSVLLEAAIFAGGVVRIYSDEATNRKRLLHLGVIETIGHGFKVAVHAAKAVNNSDSATSLHKHLIEQLGRLIEQLIGALRNFSQESGGRSRILDAGVMGTVCSLLPPFRHQSELVLNAARITAKLSLLDTFRSQINAKQQNVKYLVELVVHEAEKCREVMLGENDTASHCSTNDNAWPQWHTWPLLSRVSFTLGNLTTSNAENRAFIGITSSCIKSLIVLLQACAGALSELYSSDTSIFSDEDSSFDQSVGSPAKSPSREADDESETIGVSDSPNRSRDHDTLDEVDKASALHNQSNQKVTSPAEQELTDATVKLLRLLANICMDKNVGAAVSSRMDVFEMLNELLVCCNQRIEERAKQHEELLLNVVATCTNVTYYACNKQTASASTENIPKRQQTSLIAMSKHLSQCLFHANSEIVLETARALGNLTRLPTILSSLTTSRTDEALVLLLSHKDMDVVSAVTGALINLSANARSRGLLTRESNAVGALVSALRRSSLRNLSTSTLICQAFHNIISSAKADLALAAGDDGASDVASDVATNPPGLLDTLDELVDLADELDDIKYANFVNVGKAVQKLLLD
jgi:hypothetical protein